MMTCPAAVRPAAPTRSPEYGAYACVAASRAASLSSAQSIVVTYVSSHVPRGTAGPGAYRSTPPNPSKTPGSRRFLAEIPRSTEINRRSATGLFPPSGEFPSKSAPRPKDADARRRAGPGLPANGPPGPGPGRARVARARARARAGPGRARVAGRGRAGPGWRGRGRGTASEAKGAGAAWTEERGACDERRGKAGPIKVPGGERGWQSLALRGLAPAPRSGGPGRWSRWRGRSAPRTPSPGRACPP
jgi:hypothetical protein